MPHVEILWRESKLITDLYFFKTGLPKMKSFPLEQKIDTVHLCSHAVNVLSTRTRGWEHGGEDERNSGMSCPLLVAMCSGGTVPVKLTHLQVIHRGISVKMLLLLFSWKLVTTAIKMITSGFCKLVLVLAAVVIPLSLCVTLF